jgi:hypothetical protein
VKQLDSGIWVFDSGYRGECPKEETEQMMYGCWMDYQFPNAIWFHVPNETGTKSGPQFVLKRQKMGVKRGVSDVIILSNGVAHCGAVMELKRADRTKSKVSKEQATFLEKVADEGKFAAIAYGAEQLKKATLFYFGLPFDVD